MSLFFEGPALLVNWLSRLPGLVNRLSFFQSHIWCFTARIQTPKCGSRASETLIFKKLCSIKCMLSKKYISISNLASMCEDVFFRHASRTVKRKSDENLDVLSTSHLFHSTRKQSKIWLSCRRDAHFQKYAFHQMNGFNKNVKISPWGVCISHNENMQTVAEGYQKTRSATESLRRPLLLSCTKLTLCSNL